MSGSSKEKLHLESSTEEVSDEREVFLKGGKKLVVSEQGADQVVEIRSESGMVELRIKLTEDGPVLQMESAKLQLKATESVEIESKRVEIKATEQVSVKSEGEVEVEGAGDVKVVGKTIHLN